MKIIWKEGDWCFHDFELYQIQRIEDGKVRGLTNGVIDTSATDFSDAIFPLTLVNKVISEGVMRYWGELKNLERVSLNYPDLHREYYRRWYEIITTEAHGEKTTPLWDNFRLFQKELINNIKYHEHASLNGIRIYR